MRTKARRVVFHASAAACAGMLTLLMLTPACTHRGTPGATLSPDAAESGSAAHTLLAPLAPLAPVAPTDLTVPTVPTAPALPTLSDTTARDVGPLHNVVVFYSTANTTDTHTPTKALYSGAQPDSDAALDQLAAIGVRTIISVDGAIPNAAGIEARGMRSIHLPIGYDGFDDTRLLQLTRATQDGLAAGSVYLHCHHGKHRSASAAAAALISLGLATPADQVPRMKVSGCSPAYTGLYARAQNARPLEQSAIDAVGLLPSVSRPGDWISAMLDIDEAMDELKHIQRHAWRVPPDHPDLVPAAVAARIVEHYRHLAESPRALAATPRPDGADLPTLLRKDAADAKVLENLLAHFAEQNAGLRVQPPVGTVGGQTVDGEAIGSAFAKVAASCIDCHAVHRD